jgi:hypothetical protein
MWARFVMSENKVEIVLPKVTLDSDTYLHGISTSPIKED